MPAIGEAVCYTSISGMRYDATVKAVRPRDRLDIDVDAGVADPVRLTDIEWVERRSFATRGTAGPKE